MFQAIDLEAPLEQPYRETFPGAARCQVTELTHYEAAPLQIMGSATPNHSLLGVAVGAATT